MTVESLPEGVKKAKVVAVEPEELWDRSRAAYKGVVLDNGLRVKVAPNVGVGDEVLIHAETGEYLYQVMERIRPLKGWPWRVRRLKTRIRVFFDYWVAAVFFPGLLFRLIRARSVGGQINVAESLFLMAAAAQNWGAGEILEIGSFQGRSTACLAFGNSQPASKVITIDPHYHGSYEIFKRNMSRLGLTEKVEAYKATSEEVARQGWARPLRLLWVDGHHEYEFVKKDIELWEPHLREGGLIALHDSDKPGVIRCIKEFLLRPGRFYAVGRIGAITYAVKGARRGETAAKCPHDDFFRKIERLRRVREKLLAVACCIGLKVPRSAELAISLANRDKNKKISPS